MDNLYILTNLLPKYRLDLNSIYHLGLVCSSNRGYLQILQNMQQQKESITIYYKNTVLCELLQTNKLRGISNIDFGNKTAHQSRYRRENNIIKYIRSTDELRVERYKKNGFYAIQRVYIDEYIDRVRMVHCLDPYDKRNKLIEKMQRKTELPTFDSW